MIYFYYSQIIPHSQFIQPRHYFVLLSFSIYLVSQKHFTLLVLLPSWKFTGLVTFTQFYPGSILLWKFCLGILCRFTFFPEPFVLFLLNLHTCFILFPWVSSPRCQHSTFITTKYVYTYQSTSVFWGWDPHDLTVTLSVSIDN